MMKFLSFEILYIFFYFQIFKNFWTLKLFFGIFWPPTNGISTPLPMEYRPPYTWYIDPPTYGIFTPLPMAYRPSYPWYFDPPIHGILTPLPMLYWTPYPWYIDPPIHGILTPLPIEYWPPTHDILTSLHIFLL
jgi:hypothetical protein